MRLPSVPAWQVSSSDGDVLWVLHIQRLPLHWEMVHGDELLRALHHVQLLCTPGHEVSLVVNFHGCHEVALYVVLHDAIVFQDQSSNRLCNDDHKPSVAPDGCGLCHQLDCCQL